MKALLRRLLRLVSPSVYQRAYGNVAWGMKSGLQRLYANGVRPRLLFDVGAHQGEFAVEFRSVFPGCSIACFEAIPACVASLRTLAETSAGVSVYPTLLGSQIKPAVPFFQLEGPAETASSVLGGWDPSVQPSAVYPMTTLDASSELHGARPDFIKLDVQGFELSVLEGGEETLRTAKVLLAEVNVLELYKGAPLLAELVAWLEKRGWVVYDILTTIRRPLDDALWQSDFVFVPKSSPLRADMRYSKHQRPSTPSPIAGGPQGASGTSTRGAVPPEARGSLNPRLPAEDKVPHEHALRETA